MKHIKRIEGFDILAHSVMTLVTVFSILPFILLFASSVTQEDVLIRYGYAFFPRKFSLDAYAYIWEHASTVFRAYGITICVSVIGTACNILLSALLAYPLSVRRLPGRRFLSFFVFFTLLFNGGLVPTYLMYTRIFHINNTLFAYIVPNFLMSAMNVLLIRTYFATSIPEVLYEAAQIDGAGQCWIWARIVMPLGKPILAAMGLLAGLGYWNDWTNGLYYIRDSSLYGIQNLLNKMITDLNVLAQNSSSASSTALANIPSASVRMAIAVTAMIPVLCLFPLLQKYFTKGIALGAVK